jgi:hypothetical protein
MVLKAQIWGYVVKRVFMDAGSGINLIYARTLKAMNISLEFLQLTDFSFHVIVPGSTNYLLGKIELDFASVIKATSDEKSWNSKSWTGYHNITQS